MKKLVFLFLCMVSQTLFCQSEFGYTESGLTPKWVTSELNNSSQAELFQKTLSWIKENYKYADVETSEQKDWIVITDLKDNLIKVSKRYYNSRYKIKIRFEDHQYTFEPIEFATKQNSKYDMGWEAFNLEDGSAYFKKGKAIKASKSFVKKIPQLFNELNRNLYKALSSE